MSFIRGLDMLILLVSANHQ